MTISVVELWRFVSALGEANFTSQFPLKFKADNESQDRCSCIAKGLILLK